MIKDSLKKRLEALEARLVPGISYCLVRLPDGTETETTIDEWFENRQEWQWIRMTRNGNLKAVQLVLAAIDEEVAQQAEDDGENASAAVLRAEAARYAAEYEESEQ